MATAKRIKVWLNWVRSAPPMLKARADAVFTGLNGNPDFSKPPFPLSDLARESEKLGNCIAAAQDRGRQARAELKSQRALVVNMLRELAHYVDLNCNGDENVLRSSGFEPAPTARVQKPTASERIRSLRAGPTGGQVWVRLVDDPKAGAYKLRWAEALADRQPEIFTEIPVLNTRPATLVKGLKPGVTYLFQVCAARDNAYTDWSDPVSYLCT